MSFKRQHIAPTPLNPLYHADEYSDFSFAVGLARYCDLPVHLKSSVLQQELFSHLLLVSPTIPHEIRNRNPKKKENYRKERHFNL
jgi:hypothetical protein